MPKKVETESLLSLLAPHLAGGDANALALVRKYVEEASPTLAALCGKIKKPPSDLWLVSLPDGTRQIHRGGNAVPVGAVRPALEETRGIFLHVLVRKALFYFAHTRNPAKDLEARYQALRQLSGTERKARANALRNVADWFTSIEVATSMQFLVLARLQELGLMGASAGMGAGGQTFLYTEQERFVLPRTFFSDAMRAIAFLLELPEPKDFHAGPVRLEFRRKGGGGRKTGPPPNIIGTTCLADLAGTIYYFTGKLWHAGIPAGAPDEHYLTPLVRAATGKPLEWGERAVKQLVSIRVLNDDINPLHPLPFVSVA